MNSRYLSWIPLLFLLPGMPIGAAQSESATPDAARLQAVIAEAKARLKLTPEQEAKLRPLVEERTAKLKAIRDKHAGDDSRRARRAMYREARPVLDDYQEKVREILDDTSS